MSSYISIIMLWFFTLAHHSILDLPFLPSPSLNTSLTSSQDFTGSYLSTTPVMMYFGFFRGLRAGDEKPWPSGTSEGPSSSFLLSLHGFPFILLWNSWLHFRLELERVRVSMRSLLFFLSFQIVSTFPPLFSCFFPVFWHLNVLPTIVGRWRSTAQTPGSRPKGSCVILGSGKILDLGRSLGADSVHLSPQFLETHFLPLRFARFLILNKTYWLTLFFLLSSSFRIRNRINTSFSSSFGKYNLPQSSFFLLVVGSDENLGSVVSFLASWLHGFTGSGSWVRGFGLCISLVLLGSGQRAYYQTNFLSP